MSLDRRRGGAGAHRGERALQLAAGRAIDALEHTRAIEGPEPAREAGFGAAVLADARAVCARTGDRPGHALGRHAVLGGVVASLLMLATRDAAADPATDRVFTAPTAWLPPANAVTGMGSVDLRAAADGRAVTGVVLGFGLGDLARVELGNDTDVRGCDDCFDELPTPIDVPRAAFRLGARQDAWFPGMPALAIGARESFAPRGSFHRARIADGYVVASRVLGPVRLHAGAQVLDAGFTGDRGDDIALGATVRPFGGIEWTPGQYPRTSVMADLAYVPRFERDGSVERVAIEWVAGWGARYQAFAWGAIELAVRHREDEGLGDSTVMIRVNGVLGGTPSGKAPPRTR